MVPKRGRNGSRPRRAPKRVDREQRIWWDRVSVMSGIWNRSTAMNTMGSVSAQSDFWIASLNIDTQGNARKGKQTCNSYEDTRLLVH